MNKKDIEFLKVLQHEMLTQDKVCQASPRFWVVQDIVRTYGIDEDYGANGQEVIYDNNKIAENLKELFEYLNDEDYLDIKYVDEEYVVVTDEDGEEKEFYDLEELVDYMHEELNYDECELYIVNYKDEYKIVENTMFLTLEECRKHIENNHYHYNKPRTYAMTAWRSPQVTRLYEILEKVDWDDLSNKQ